MATLEREIVELKERVERLEAVIRRLLGNESPGTLSAFGKTSSQEELLAWLKTQGLLREPTPEERRLAAEWDALPAEEKKAHMHFMHNLALEPPLSQIIIDQRR
jgi:hypothetical protein